MAAAIYHFGLLAKKGDAMLVECSPDELATFRNRVSVSAAQYAKRNGLHLKTATIRNGKNRDGEKVQVAKGKTGLLVTYVGKAK